MCDCCISSAPIIIPPKPWDPNQQVWDISNTATGKWPYCILLDNFTLSINILAIICFLFFLQMVQQLQKPQPRPQWTRMRTAEISPWTDAILAMTLSSPQSFKKMTNIAIFSAKSRMGTSNCWRTSAVISSTTTLTSNVMVYLALHYNSKSCERSHYLKAKIFLQCTGQPGKTFQHSVMKKVALFHLWLTIAEENIIAM